RDAVAVGEVGGDHVGLGRHHVERRRRVVLGGDVEVEVGPAELEGERKGRAVHLHPLGGGGEGGGRDGRGVRAGGDRLRRRDVLALVEDDRALHSQRVPDGVGVERGRAGERLLRTLGVAPDDEVGAGVEQGGGGGGEVLRRIGGGERLAVVD